MKAKQVPSITMWFFGVLILFYGGWFIYELWFNDNSLDFTIIKVGFTLLIFALIMLPLSIILQEHLEKKEEWQDK